MTKTTVFFVLCWMLLAGCQTNNDLTASEIDEIKTSVKTVFDTMVDGMNEHDADKIMECYLKDESLRYAVDGELVLGWNAMNERAQAGHDDPDEYSPVTINDVYVDVLTRDVATVSALGTIEFINADRDTVQILYAITDVFKRMENGWKVVNEHESTSFDDNDDDQEADTEETQDD